MLGTQRFGRTSRRMRNESASREDWYVISDGSDGPYIVHREEIKDCIDGLVEIYVHNAYEALRDALDERGSRSSRLFVNAIIEELNGRPHYQDDDLYIIVYRVDDDVISHYNDYAQDMELPLVDETDPTEEQIRKALWSRSSDGLFDFLVEERCEDHSYYIPEEVLENDAVLGLAQEVQDMMEGSSYYE